MIAIKKTIPGAGCVLILYGLISTAWLSDDIRLTFRAVKHLMLGYGPVWKQGILNFF